MPRQKSGYSAAPFLLLGVASPLFGQGIDLDSIVTFAGQSFGVVSPTVAPLVTDIDEQIVIAWDEARLLRDVGLALHTAAPGDPLAGRIDFLSELVRSFQDAQAALLEAKRLGAGLEVARLAGGDTAQASADFQRAVGETSAALLPSLTAFTDDPELPERLGGPERAGRIRAILNRALLTDYESTAGALGLLLQDELEALDGELQARLGAGGRVTVRVDAFLNSAGQRRPLSLGVPTGPRVPYERFQFAASDRTRRELEAAQDLRRIVEDPDALREQVDAVFTALREELEGLASQLQSGRLFDSVNGLVAGLRGEVDSTLVRLRRQGEDALGLLQALETGEGLDAGGDVQTLLRLSRRVDGMIQGIVASFGELRVVLPRLADGVEAAAADLPGALAADAGSIVGQVRLSVRQFPDRAEVEALRDRVAELGAILGITVGVVEAGGDLRRFEAALGANEALDTELFLDAAGERHPGDLVDIVMSVVATDSVSQSERVLASSHQSLRLGVLGLYVEPRGALLFADPRTSGFSGQNYEATPSLSWVAHYGFRNSKLWNDLLNPGLALTIALLDFSDDEDLEVGLSGSLTLLRDFILVGYGFNLQADAEYFYVGVNPLAFGDLLRLRGSSSPGG